MRRRIGAGAHVPRVTALGLIAAVMVRLRTGHGSVGGGGGGGGLHASTRMRAELGCWMDQFQ